MNWHNKKEKEAARKRAKKLLADYTKSGLSLSAFAKTQGCSRQALTKRLAKAE